MNTPTEEVASSEQRVAPTPAPIRIKNVDFYGCQLAHQALSEARAFQTAWDIAAKGKAPHAVRSTIRWHMRYHAVDAVRYARKEARKNAERAALIAELTK